MKIIDKVSINSKRRAHAEQIKNNNINDFLLDNLPLSEGNKYYLFRLQNFAKISHLSFALKNKCIYYKVPVNFEMIAESIKSILITLQINLRKRTMIDPQKITNQYFDIYLNK